MKSFLLNRRYVQPRPEDPDFMLRLYHKKEFAMNRVPERPLMDRYEDVKAYRDQVCRNFQVAPQQAFVSNYINPNTNNMGLLVFHGVGSGKTCAGIRIAEGFKEQVRKYATKIYVLVPGTLIKEGWKRDLLGACTQGAYLNQDQLLAAASQKEQARLYRQAMQDIYQHYRIMSHKSFYKRVLGEKLLDRRFQTEDSKKKYLMTESGEVQREYVVDRIERLDNTILIVDEAQKVANNEFGAAIQLIKENSKNLRIVLLSATPTKNVPADLVYLLNLVRPLADPIQPDLVYRRNKEGDYVIRPENVAYLEQKARGFVSYYRGAHPLTFAEADEQGAAAPHLEFTRVVRCPMRDLQLATYEQVRRDFPDDTLLKRATAISNFVVPGLADGELVGHYGEDGFQQVVQQLKHSRTALLQQIKDRYFEKFVPAHDILFEKNRQLGGLLFHRRYIGSFSAKFLRLLQDLDGLFGKEPQTGFLYSDYVKTGVEMVEATLLANGFLPYSASGNYNLRATTRCYRCGAEFATHAAAGKSSGGAARRGAGRGAGRGHEFHPATFLSLTGGESSEEITQQDEKFQLIANVFNDVNNRDGRHLKLIVGSRVMNEGVTLENIGALFILDANHNLNQVHQAIGRGLRYCKHYNVMSEQNPYPRVRIYRYVVAVKRGPSADEEIYAKAERKYKVIKVLERVLKRAAVDCPFFLHANVYPEDAVRHPKCMHLPADGSMAALDTQNCPAECDFTSCEYTCADPQLNERYLRPGAPASYLPPDRLDRSSFALSIVNSFLKAIKMVIKRMYRFQYVYTLPQIRETVLRSGVLQRMEDDDPDFYIYKALTDLVPTSENDFNNLRDLVFDKYSTKGYLIHRGEYYIFQPFSLPEDASLFHRMIYRTYLANEISLASYVKNNVSDRVAREITRSYTYDFASNRLYYEQRGFNAVYGVVDRAGAATLEDSFKLRRAAAAGDRGMACTSYRIDELRKIRADVLAHPLLRPGGLGAALGEQLAAEGNGSKESICEQIHEALYFIEKYSAAGAGARTFLVVPYNHPSLPFPLNLEDHAQLAAKEVRDSVQSPHLRVEVQRVPGNLHRGQLDPQLFHYRVTVHNSAPIQELLRKVLPELEFELIGDRWTLLVQ